MHYRHLELDKISAVRANKGFHYGLVVPELTWWVNNVLTASKPISNGNPDLTLNADASNVGWGAVCGDTSTGVFGALRNKDTTYIF